tara:strand:- start:201188 stop:202267 length:1080 start_codon:yes stop_codon:yes gene_type:complete
MKKQVYIINFHHVLNYGAVLQGYALCKVVEKMGHDAKLIDYRPMYFVSQTYRPAKGVLKSFRKGIMNLNFYRFRRDYFKLTAKPFYSDKGLYRYFKNSNASFICGSDQVWNAKITNGRLDPGYFLDFVPQQGRKIAYAASIGHTKFDREEMEEISKRLKSYHAISVREHFAKNDIKDVTNNQISPTIVLDPTLLLDDYSELLNFKLVPEKEYMVVYTTENSNDFRKYVKMVSNNLNLPIINLGHYHLEGKTSEYTNVHPSEWLGLFSKASYVCTNSFHGTAFSIVFNRNFSVLGRSTLKNLNTRQITLLNNLGIGDRFIEKIGDFNIEKHLSQINYDSVDKKLKFERENSMKFLMKALS